jgi:hypothetical protein
MHPTPVPAEKTRSWNLLPDLNSNLYVLAAYLGGFLSSLRRMEKKLAAR